jgi:hypothetical protein
MKQITSLSDSGKVRSLSGPRADDSGRMGTVLRHIACLIGGEDPAVNKRANECNVLKVGVWPTAGIDHTDLDTGTRLAFLTSIPIESCHQPLPPGLAFGMGRQSMVLADAGASANMIQYPA